MRATRPASPPSYVAGQEPLNPWDAQPIQMTLPDGRYFGPVDCGNTAPFTDNFGNMVLVQGATNGWSFPQNLYFGAQAGPGEIRNLSCINSTTFWGNRIGCVSHFDLDTGVSANQDNETFLQAGAYVDQGRMPIVGMDRNREDWRSWPTRFVEFDLARQPNPLMKTHPAPSPNRKIDWIFGGPGHWAKANASQWCPNSQTGLDAWTSDHCLLWGAYSF